MRLAVPAFAGGFLYLLSGIITTSTLNGAPTVGLLQGLEPALSGVASPTVSPRAAEVKFISHHAFPLIAGSVLAGIAIGALTLVLLLLADATRFRRPQTWAAARPLILVGGITLAVVSIGHQVVVAIETHNFATGHDLSNHAVDTRAHQRHGERRHRLLRPARRARSRRRDDRHPASTPCASGSRPLDGRARDLHRDPDLPADRRRRPLRCPGLLARGDGHPVRRQMAERAAAGVGVRRVSSVAFARADASGSRGAGAKPALAPRGGDVTPAPASRRRPAPRASVRKRRSRAERDRALAARAATAVQRP